MSLAVRYGEYMKDRDFQAFILAPPPGEKRKPQGLRPYPVVKKRPKK